MQNWNLSNASWARKDGTAYERFAQQWFAERFPSEFRSDLTFEFDGEDGRLTLQPDGLLFLPGRIVLLEIKRSTGLGAWFQLRWIYGPVVRAAYGTKVCDLCVAEHVYLPVKDCPEPGWIVSTPEQAKETGLWIFQLRRPAAR